MLDSSSFDFTKLRNWTLLLVSYILCFSVMAQSIPEPSMVVFMGDSSVSELFTYEKGKLHKFEQLGDTVFFNQETNSRFLVSGITDGEQMLSFFSSRVPLGNRNRLMVVRPFHFDFDSFQLTNKAQGQIDIIVALLQLLPQLKIRFIVSTDSKGDMDYNRELARKRILAISEYLLQADCSLDSFAFEHRFGKVRSLKGINEWINRAVYIETIF